MKKENIKESSFQLLPGRQLTNEETIAFAEDNEVSLVSCCFFDFKKESKQIVFIVIYVEKADYLMSIEEFNSKEVQDVYVYEQMVYING